MVIPKPRMCRRKHEWSRSEHDVYDHHGAGGLVRGSITRDSHDHMMTHPGRPDQIPEFPRFP